MSDPFDTTSRTSVTLMRPILRALGAQQDVPASVSAFPSACRWVPPIRTLVCATPILVPRLYRDAMVTAAWQRHVDTIVVRHGAHPEILDPVEVDIVVGRQGPARIFWRYVPARTAAGAYWFFPAPGETGHYLKLDADGIMPVGKPPYAGPDERSDCVVRAAKETILSLRQGRRS